MLRSFIVILALVSAACAQTAPAGQPPPARGSQTSSQPTPKLLSVAESSMSEDSAAEGELLQLANQHRKEAGVPPLHASAGLLDAARAHARLMIEKQQLSHQFDGERSLFPRLRDSGLTLDSVGENVTYHYSMEKAFDALMQSPPHRQNLLDPDFNIAGVAAFWSGNRLYVVQDFAHQVSEMLPAAKHQR